MKKLANFWDKLPDKNVQCKLCAWRCKITPEKVGVCRARKNEDKTLHTL
jgi:pyruvate formate lyase activating enzyme